MADFRADGLQREPQRLRSALGCTELIGRKMIVERADPFSVGERLHHQPELLHGQLRLAENRPVILPPGCDKLLM